MHHLLDKALVKMTSRKAAILKQKHTETEEVPSASKAMDVFFPPAYHTFFILPLSPSADILAITISSNLCNGQHSMYRNH